MITPHPSTCRECPLDTVGQGFAQYEGSGVNGVALVGEGLGYHEMYDSLPFRPHAPAGHVLENAIRSLGFDRQQFIIGNVVNCRPPSNELVGMPYEIEAIDHCKVHFRQLMERFHPRVIVALGATAIRTLTGMTGKNHMTVDMLQGFRLPAIDYPGVWVIPCWHPSYIVRGQWEVFPVLRRIVALAVRTARDGYVEEEVDYNEDAGVDELEWLHGELAANPDMPLSVDFETTGNIEDPSSILEDGLVAEIEALSDPDFIPVVGLGKREEKKKKTKKSDVRWDKITQINLAIKPGQAFAVNFHMEPNLHRAVRRLLATPNPKVGHNFWMFDIPVAIKNDLRIGGTHLDTMWQFHWIYSDIPGKKGKVGEQKEEGSLANLQFCASFYGFPWPWKHLFGDRPGFYGSCDADATLRVYHGITAEMKQMGVWDSYLRMVQDIWPILDNMQRRGIPVNRDKLQAFVSLLRGKAGEVLKNIQPKIPLDLLPMKQKQGLRKVPRDTTGLVKKTFVLEQPERCSCARKRNLACRACRGAGNLRQLDLFESPSGEITQLETNIEVCEVCKGVGKIVSQPADPGCCACSGTGRLEGEVTRWFKPQLFKPTSWMQLKKYAHYKLHKIPKNSKKKIAMDKETLERMARKYMDPVYVETIEYREFVKMYSVYGDGWMPKTPDDCVHTQFTFAPASGQFSSLRPNIQNCFSPDTEILTLQGWVTFDNLRSGTHVAQFDALTERIEFVPPSRIVSATFNGFLRHIHSEQQIDLLVTPDHECLLQSRKSKKFIKVTAEKYLRDARQYAAGIFVGGDVRMSEAKIALLCALQADGSVTRHGHYDFSLWKKRKRDRLLWALREAGVVFTEKYGKARKIGKNRTRLRVTVNHNNIPEWWKDRKLFDWSFLALDRASLNILATEVFFWDGCWNRRSMYSSNEKSNADIVQAILCLSGKRAKIRPYHNGNPNAAVNWQVDVSNKKFSHTSMARNEQLEYDGKVYCVTVPTGNIVVRRNGVVAITGNSPNQVKYGQLAVQFNECLEAKPGHVWVAFDYKSYHAQTFAWEAKDWSFLRLAKLDIHSFLAAFLLKLPGREKVLSLSDGELMEWLKWIKKNHEKTRNKQAKPAILGYNLGLGAQRLHDTNRDSFNNVKEAQYVIDMLTATFPVAAAYRAAIPLIAKKQRYLKNVFGAIRWFWNVETWDFDNKRWTHGMDWERSIAFCCQADAFCHKKLAMRRIENHGASEKYWLASDKHDELLFHCPVGLVDECRHVVKREMEMPSEIMLMPDGSGFGVEVEVKSGKTWATFEEIK